MPALWAGLLVISVFLGLKMVTKIVGVFPLARLNYMKMKEASYTTLLMATGLTFGTISSLYGLQNGIIDQNQYTILVSVVILSAFVPTLIAQKFFQPTVEMMHAWGHVYRRRLGTLQLRTLTRNIRTRPRGSGRQNPRGSQFKISADDLESSGGTSRDVAADGTWHCNGAIPNDLAL